MNDEQIFIFNQAISKLQLYDFKTARFLIESMIEATEKDLAHKKELVGI